MLIASLLTNLLRPATASAVRRTFHFEAAVPAAAERVFPLLCPIREEQWIEGWRARAVYSKSGVAEDGAIFETRLRGRETWITSRYEPESYRVEYSIFARRHATLRLDLALVPEAGDRSRLDITRTYTGIDAVGRALVQALEADGVEAENALLARQLAHYLLTGEMLRR